MNEATPRYGLRNVVPLSEENSGFLRLRRQWAILENEDPSPPGWDRQPITSSLVFVAHPDAPVIETHSPDGPRRALLIGTAVNPGLGSAVRSIDADHLGSHDQRVDFLHRVGGVYALVWVDSDRVQIYTDPGALMAIYYGAGRAASTPTLLPGLKVDAQLVSEYSFKSSDDWYPGDLVPFEGVTALLANHVLDVRSGRSERFWPTEPPPEIDFEEGVESVSNLLRGMASGYLAAGPCLFSLTGGQDSRVNLAAVRPWVEDIQFFTIRGPRIKDCDVVYAGELARRFELDHRFIENPPTPAWLAELHAELCAGMQTRGATSVLGACIGLSGPDMIHVSGALGAITKSMFWPSKRPRDVTVDALANEFIQKPPVLLDALTRWRNTLDPSLPATMVYNLMYLEQRGGRWQSVSELGSNLFYRPATLFASREVFEGVCGIPAERQYGGGLLFDFTRRLWPELLEVPYCRVTANFGTYLPKWARVGLKKLLRKPV